MRADDRHRIGRARRRAGWAPGLGSGLWLLLGLGAAGCASMPVGTLDGVLLGGELARGPEIEEVRVVRGDSAMATRFGMTVRSGDTIQTGPDAVAVLTLNREWELILEENASLYIVNPRAWLKKGRLFVKKTVDTVREALRVEGEYVTWAAEGTEFLLEAQGDSMMVAVLDGVVSLRSKRDLWEPVSYGAGERGRTVAEARPERLAPLTRGEIAELRRRIEEVERRLIVRVPDLRGTTLVEAWERIAEAGLSSGGVVTVVTGSVRPGLVARHTPRPRTEVRVGTQVDLEIEEESVLVPPVMGMSEDEAVREIRRAGLQVGRIDEVEDPQRPDGTVIGQTPDPDTRLATGERVRLRVTRAPLRLRAVALDSASVECDTQLQGTVFLTRPADREVTVALSSNDVNRVRTPRSVVVPEGESSARFTLQIIPSERQFDVVITGRYADETAPVRLRLTSCFTVD